MSTIAYSSPSIAVEATPAAPAKSLWIKLYERMVASQQLRAEKTVASYLASHGGVITDDLEREIMVRLNASGSLNRMR